MAANSCTRFASFLISCAPPSLRACCLQHLGPELISASSVCVEAASCPAFRSLRGGTDLVL